MLVVYHNCMLGWFAIPLPFSLALPRSVSFSRMVTMATIQCKEYLDSEGTIAGAIVLWRLPFVMVLILIKIYYSFTTKEHYLWLACLTASRRTASPTKTLFDWNKKICFIHFVWLQQNLYLNWKNLDKKLLSLEGRKPLFIIFCILSTFWTTSSYTLNKFMM